MRKTIMRVLRYTKSSWGYLGLAIISTLAGVLLSLYAPILVGRAVDLAVGEGKTDFPALGAVLWELAVMVLVSGIFQWFSGLCVNRLAFGTVRRLRTELTEKLGRMPLSYIDSHARGDIMARVVPDIETLSDGLLQGFAQLFTGLVTIGGTLYFMMARNARIAMVVVLMTPLSLLLAAKLTALSHDTFQAQAKLRGDISALTEELVENQRVVKAFAYEERAQARFTDVNAALGEAGRKATFFSSISNPATRFVNGLIYAAVGTLGALGAIGVFPWVGVMSIGTLASFLSYANQYTKPFNEISGVITELQNAVLCAQRVFEVLDAPAEPDDSHCQKMPEKVLGHIEFRDVSFAYLPERPLITHFCMEAKPGERVAIVGPTGCGKTTIINLLLRFYEVDAGAILIDGQDTRHFTRDGVRGLFGMVLQETWIFTGTVAENIAYGKPDATPEEIERAARAAYAHSFIQRLPEGYHTVISENSGLSGGQKQLLCIARIMLTNPPMLILDEATSSIDLRTEQRVQRAFEKLMQGRTSFIIAHRLSTIQGADLILVMRDGHIEEQGTHRELMEKGGFYANLYQSQFAGSAEGEEK